MRKLQLPVGYRSGRLTAVSPVTDRKGNMWECLCECGNTTLVEARSLKYATTKSCGCLHREHIVEVAKRNAFNMRLKFPHGKRLVSLFCGMINRCYRDYDDRTWASYGGRGIKICDEWREDRHKFYEWATKNGYEPGLEIDRIDVNGDYSPDNCRFVSTSVNANNRRNNRRITWNNESRTVTEWARFLKMDTGTLFYRLNNGWSVERALTQPVRK